MTWLWLAPALAGGPGAKPVFEIATQQEIRIHNRDEAVVVDARVDLSGWRAMTVSMEVRIDRHTTYDTVLYYGRVDGQPTDAGFALQLGGSASKAQFNPIQGGKGVPAQAPSIAPAIQARSGWHQVVGVWDRERVTLYVDGKAVGVSERTNWDELYDETDVNQLVIGRSGGHRWGWRDAWLHGAVRKVQIWDQAMRPEELGAPPR